MDNSYKGVRILLDELIDLRKKTPREISDYYAKRNKDILKYLNNVKINIREGYELSDITLNSSIENFNVKQINQQLDNQLLEKVYKQIQLLKILIKKKDCPISKIIDEI